MTESRPHTESELIEFVRAIDVPAPQALHDRVRAMTAERPRRGPLAGALSPLRVGMAAAVVALAAVVVVLTLPGSPGGPSLRETAALALRPATLAAPAESPRDHSELAASVDGVSFPYWGDRFGWRSNGARVDTVGGRPVRTVFYVDGRGQRIGYAIVSGSAPRVGGGRLSWREGTPYRVSRENGMLVVSWLRSGHLCVVSGRGVPASTLVRLASWDDHGTLT